MKKYNILKISLCALSLFIIGCNSSDDSNQKMYNGGSLLHFNGTSTSVGLEDGGEDVILDVAYSVIAPLKQDATVSLVLIEEESTAVEGVDFEFLGNDQISQGDLGGVLQVKFLATSDGGKTAVFGLQSSTIGNAVFKQKFIVTTVLTCPIPSTIFVGSYLIEELTPPVDGYTFNHGSVVTLSTVSGNSVRRVFSTSNYPTYCPGTNNPFYFDLICGEVVALYNNNLCVCSSGTEFFGPALVHSTYNVNDDSVFELTFTNDVHSDCGPPQQTTYRFTKQ